MSESDKKEDPNKNYDFSQEAVMKRLESGKQSMKAVKDSGGRGRTHKAKPSGKLDTQLFPNRKPLYHE